MIEEPMQERQQGEPCATDAGRAPYTSPPARHDRGKPEEYWLARDNVEVEILAYIAMKSGRHGVFPSVEELCRQGFHRLAWAVVDFGGPAPFLDSLSLASDPADRSWDGLQAGLGRQLFAAIASAGPNQPVARAGRALAALSEYLRLGGECPTTSEIRAAGCGWIESAARRHNTPLQWLAARAGLKTSRLNNPKMYLADPGNLRREVEELIREHGLAADVLPSQGTLRELGRDDIENSIIKHHGGHVRARQLLGMRGPDDDLPDGHWNDLENVRAGILDLLRAKGQAGTRNQRMPSRRELEQAGLRGLDHAVRKHGGYAAVARKLGMLLPAAGRGAGVGKVPGREEENATSEVKSG